ncbi:MAG: phosphatase PAP2 family protein [Acidobacteria bacterium]|nr:MAG: phosphatase PAP2 family protein [Acidobacteriota bacterium]
MITLPFVGGPFLLSFSSFILHPSSFSRLPTWLVIGYLVIHSFYIVTARYRSAHRVRALLTNFGLVCLFALLLVGLGQAELYRERWFRIVALWSPVAFFWWAYLWAGLTLHAYYPRDFSYDSRLIRLEDRLFNQPSLWLAAGEKAWLTDLLHFLYNTYYAYTPILALYLHINGRLAEFQSVTFAVTLGYAFCYSFFPLMPVFGPRWGLVDAGLLPPSRSRLRGGWMTRITNVIMWQGPAHKGCAMPSAHSSTAVVFLIWSSRIWGDAGGLLAAVIVAGMVLGAVYGRYHYVVDMIVGGALGIISVLVADWLM